MESAIEKNTGIPPRGRQCIEEAIESAFKAKPTVLAYNKINNKTEVTVCRVRFQLPDRTTHSLIAKHMPFNSDFFHGKNSCHPALQNELIAYEFLMHIREKFSLFPKLLGFSNGIMLLEDLGEDNFNFEDETSAQEACISTFANLHACTSGKQSVYVDIENKLKFSERGYRVLPFNDSGRHFELGWQYICSLAGPPGVKINIGKETNNIQRMVQKPGVFYSFLHNDFLSRRQSIVKKGKFFLIDFEHSKFSHALLDFWQIYVGKIEYNIKKGIYFRKRFNYIHGMDSFYRKQFEDSAGRQIDEKEWQTHLYGILIYLSVCMIGNLLYMPYYLKACNGPLLPTVSFQQELKQLLQFLQTSLSEKRIFAGSGKLFELCLQKLQDKQHH